MKLIKNICHCEEQRDVAISYKRAAMFGLCRALRKQSGGLFLASRHSEAPQGANGSVKATRGAMFGLDARIALAIFGALSVISGAALYSAIQNAKATAVLADLNEIGKAWEQYYLDTGQDLTIYGTTGSHPYFVKTGDFIVNPGVSGWNGPYLPYGLDIINNNILHYPDGRTTSPIQRIYLVHSNSTNWVYWDDGMCNTQSDCYIWMRITYFKNSDLSLIKKIDEIVDNSDGADKGNFRYDNISTPGYIHIDLKYAPLPN